MAPDRLDLGLNRLSDHGHSREQQVREIAAQLGVADFIYVSPQVRKGAALREPSGDGLVIVGECGAVLQVKARDPRRSQDDPPERAIAWLKKNAEQARLQGLGTKRELARRQSGGAPVIVWPVRALELEPQARDRYVNAVTQSTDKWPVLVVLDHSNAPEIELGFDREVIWFTLSDWRELHRRLRSTAALLEYAQRVLESQINVPLGQEGRRYAALRAAEEKTRIGNRMPFLVDMDDVEEIGVDLFSDIIEKVWPDDGIIPWTDPGQYRAIVEFLDAVPPAVRGEVGRWFLRKRRELINGRESPSGLVKLEDDRLVYICSSRDRWRDLKDWQSEVGALATLRHVQAIRSGAPTTTVTLAVAVLVVEDPAPAVSYCFVMLRGAEARRDLPRDLRRNLEWRYGMHDHRAGTTTPIVITRNEPCPCLSGRKFKKCCGRTGAGDKGLPLSGFGPAL